VNDDADHLSELTATLAANGGGESSSDLALDLVLNEIVEQARVTTSASGAAIALERQGEMVWRASSGESAPELGITVDTANGLAADCVGSLRVQCCDDSDLDVRVDAGACHSLGIRSIVMVPVLERERVIGLLEALSPRAAAFSAREIQGLQTLTRRIIDNVKQAEHVRTGSTRPTDEISDDGQPEFPPLNFGAEPDRPRWFKRDVLTGILTAVVILLAGLLGWMVGRAGWDMAVRSSDAQLTATSIQPPAEESADANPAESVKAQKPEKQKSVTRKKPPEAAPVESPAASSAPTASQEHSSTTEALVAAKPAVPETEVKPQKNLSEPPVGGLVVYEKGKLVYRSPSSKQGQISSDAGDNALLNRVEPEYPQQARENGIEGAVVLKVLVGIDGSVENVHAVSGDPVLAGAAEYAVRQWRFRPYLANGHPTEFETRVTVKFAHP
jgi:TonB family protein